MNKPILVQFADNPQEEIDAIVRESQVIPLLARLDQKDELQPEDRALIRNTVGALVEFMSPNLPRISDVDTDLRRAAQEMNVARVLREKASARLYMLVNRNGDDGLPLYKKVLDPDTGLQFRTQEDFLSWFSTQAHVSRSLIFLRKKTYNRLVVGLGMTMEEAFRVVMLKPYSIYQTLEDMGVWDKEGKLIAIQDTTAEQVGRLLPPGKLQNNINEAIAEGDEVKIIEATIPAIINLVNEVADHENARDARDFVKHDVLQKPRITSWWDEGMDCPIIQYEILDTDERGNTYVAHMERFPLVPDTPELPADVRAYLITRLSVKNRDSLAF